MQVTTWGIVKEGKIIPHQPLPEGVLVQIVLSEGVPEVPPELQEEFEAWERAGASAMDVIVEMEREEKPDGER
jgi:hypothetical protein